MPGVPGRGRFRPHHWGREGPIGDACTTLARWDLRWDVSQRGAVLFGVFWAYADSVDPANFTHPFELSDPVHTPYGLNTSNPAVQQALGDAISALDQAHIPLNATVGSVQYVTYHGAHIPIPAVADPDGIFNDIVVGAFPGDSPTAPDLGSPSSRS